MDKKIKKLKIKRVELYKDHPEIIEALKYVQDFRCDICGHPIEEEYGLCDTCWDKAVWHS